MDKTGERALSFEEFTNGMDNINARTLFNNAEWAARKAVAGMVRRETGGVRP